MPRILALSGSLRAGSHSTALLRAAAESAGDDLDLILFDGLRDIPPFDEDAEADLAAHPGLVKLRTALREADAVLVATPEYNGSIPGVLKNAFDWVSRPLEGNPLSGKPVAIISASTGSFGGLWAQNDLRRILGTLHARVITETLTVPYVHTLVDGEGELAHDETSAGIEGVLAALTAELPQEATA
jgi:chromate reductase